MSGASSAYLLTMRGRVVLASALLGGSAVLATLPAAAATAQGLTVVSSSTYADPSGNVHAVGEVRNPGTSVLGGPAIAVTARNSGGVALMTVAATTTLDALLPGELSGFSAIFAPPAGYASATVGSASALPATSIPDRRLSVTVTPAGDGTVSGTVRNTDSATARDVSVALTFYDSSGRTVDATSIYVGGGAADIASGASSRFSAATAQNATTVSAIAQAENRPSLPGGVSCPIQAGLSVGSTAPASGRTHLLTPSRILDTRVGSRLPQAAHRLCGASNIEVQVTGRGGVPASGVSAVFLNLTGISDRSASAITAYAAGGPVPIASNVNLAGTLTRGQFVLVPVNASGRIGLASSAGNVDLLADVMGWVDNGSGPGSGISTVPPARLADTRRASRYQGAGATLSPGGRLRVQVTGRGGVPAGAVAALVNVTVVNPSAATYVTANATGTSDGTSTVNATPGQVVANRALVPVDPSGSIWLYNSAGRTDALVDITGYVGTGGEQIATITPSRLVDTRQGTNTPFPDTSQRLGPRGTLTIQITGNGGVPASSPAAFVTITGVSPSAGSFLVAYAAGTARAPVSDVNWSGPGTVTPNVALSQLSAGGAMTVYNAAGTVDVLVDVNGYLTD